MGRPRIRGCVDAQALVFGSRPAQVERGGAFLGWRELSEERLHDGGSRRLGRSAGPRLAAGRRGRSRAEERHVVRVDVVGEMDGDSKGRGLRWVASQVIAWSRPLRACAKGGLLEWRWTGRLCETKTRCDAWPPISARNGSIQSHPIQPSPTDQWVNPAIDQSVDQRPSSVFRSLPRWSREERMAAERGRNAVVWENGDEGGHDEAWIVGGLEGWRESGGGGLSLSVSLCLCPTRRGVPSPAVPSDFQPRRWTGDEKARLHLGTGHVLAPTSPSAPVPPPPPIPPIPAVSASSTSRRHLWLGHPGPGDGIPPAAPIR